MSLDYTLGLVQGLIFATALWTLGYDLLLRIFKKEVKIVDKQNTKEADGQ